MLQSNKPKQISKSDMEKKVQAWKTINEVLVQANSNFMNTLASMLTEKQVQVSQLEEKLKGENGTEEENAEYLFQSGYVQCLKDILNAKKTQN
jgi:Holliday junction resolvasome RuvABC ATP-dependent DNA helicase subunit